MKRKKRKFFIVALLKLLLLNVIAGDPRYTALNFGNDDESYILFKPDMEPLRNQFTICSWIRSFQETDGSPQTWISYASHSTGLHNEIMLGDAGVSFLFNTELKPPIRPSFADQEGNRTWYHFCTSWSFSSRSQKFYLNGNEINETNTPEGRKLALGGYLAIGSDQGRHGAGSQSTDRFRGELYKLNLFSKELNGSEVREMSRYMCAEIEETYGELRHIKWEDIVQQKQDRKGNVTDVDSGCPSRLWTNMKRTEQKLLDTVKELEDTKTQLGNTTGELSQVRKEKEGLEKVQNETTKELSQVRKNKEGLEETLNETTAELNLIEQEKLVLETNLSRTEQQLTTTNLELEISMNKSRYLTSELNKSNENANDLFTRLQAAEDNSSTLLVDLNETKENLTGLQVKLKETKENLTGLLVKLKEHKDTLKARDDQLQNSQKIIEKLSTYINEA